MPGAASLEFAVGGILPFEFAGFSLLFLGLSVYHDGVMVRLLILWSGLRAAR